MPVHRSELEALLATVIDAEAARGVSWWPGVEMAPIAYRRLTTFQRRYKGASPSSQDRALDLAKGLTAHFEPDIPYMHPSDWLHLSSLLVETYIRRVE